MRKYSGMPSINKQQLFSTIFQKLSTIGFNQNEVNAIIRSWEYAQLSEKYSHGFDRLPWLLEMVQAGKVVPNKPLSVKNNGLVTSIEANKGLGYLAAEKATETVIALGKDKGVGFVTVYNCYPTGCMGQYTEAIAQDGLIGFAITHSPPRVAPHGGSEAVFSTSGHSFSFPSQDAPYIYDSSVGATTNGQIMILHKLGKKLPTGSVLSKNGQFTENTSDVINEKGLFDGVIASAGGIHAHKMSGLAGSLELLASLGLVGKPKVGSYSFFMAINPELFGTKEEYKSLVSELQEHIVSSKPITAGQKVYFAGQQSYMKRHQNRKKDQVLLSNETFTVLFPERSL